MNSGSEAGRKPVKYTRVDVHFKVCLVFLPEYFPSDWSSADPSSVKAA